MTSFYSFYVILHQVPFVIRKSQYRAKCSIYQTSGLLLSIFSQDETLGLNPHYSVSVIQLVVWGFRRR
jgi:hypothetical protein